MTLPHPVEAYRDAFVGKTVTADFSTAAFLLSTTRGINIIIYDPKPAFADRNESRVATCYQYLKKMFPVEEPRLAV